MNDLVIGYTALAAAAIALFLATSRLARWLSGLTTNLLCCAVVGGLLYYIGSLWHHPVLTRWLPHSNLVVIGNWLPLFAAVIAALVWQRTAHAPLRRAATSIGLVGCATFAAVFPLLGVAPRCENQWDDLGTCLQTTPYTCSPACAAMLLRRYGIEATEAEMAELCLTRGGTSWQGLYRGMKLKTTGTEWDVEVRDVSADELQPLRGGPMILSVGLAADAQVSREFTREFGWVPGVNHSVVLESWQTGDLAIIADPSQEMSREHWDGDTMRLLFRGTMLRLIPRAR